MNGWKMEERGWWTHQQLGGVVKEQDMRWHCYPSWKDNGRSEGDFPSLKEAKEWLTSLHFAKQMTENRRK